jgi:hypothetical protein
MGVLEAVLAVVGLVALVALAAGNLTEPEPPSIEDAAAPYREGLHAAIRMQRVAEELEQQIYAEAARHRQSEAFTSHALERP